MQLQAPYYAIGLSNSFAIEFDIVIVKAEKKNMLDSSTSLDANIVLVHSSSKRQYLCPRCKRGMKQTTLTRVRLAPIGDFKCKHPLRLTVLYELYGD